MDRLLHFYLQGAARETSVLCNINRSKYSFSYKHTINELFRIETPLMMKRLRFHRSHIYLRDGWPHQNCLFKVKLKSLTICVPYSSRNMLVFKMYKDGFAWSKNKARVKASQVDFPREQIWSFKQVEAFCEYAKLL